MVGGPDEWEEKLCAGGEICGSEGGESGAEDGDGLVDEEGEEEWVACFCVSGWFNREMEDVVILSRVSLSMRCTGVA